MPILKYNKSSAEREQLHNWETGRRLEGWKAAGRHTQFKILRVILLKKMMETTAGEGINLQVNLL